jgi:hypothetical protein
MKETTNTPEAERGETAETIGITTVVRVLVLLTNETINSGSSKSVSRR